MCGQTPAANSKPLLRHRGKKGERLSGYIFLRHHKFLRGSSTPSEPFSLAKKTQQAIISDLTIKSKTQRRNHWLLQPIFRTRPYYGISITHMDTGCIENKACTALTNSHTTATWNTLSSSRHPHTQYQTRFSQTWQHIYNTRSQNKASLSFAISLYYQNRNDPHFYFPWTLSYSSLVIIIHQIKVSRRPHIFALQVSNWSTNSIWDLSINMLRLSKSQYLRHMLFDLLGSNIETQFVK